MNNQVLQFFDIQRQVFGICPCCGEFFRLSDCHIFKKARPPVSWLDRLQRQEMLLSMREETIQNLEESLRDAAREKGRRRARAAVRRIDPVFAPMKFDADDAKVLMHPIDYVVFCGMKSRQDHISRIVLLDRGNRTGEARTMQRSIEHAVEKGRTEWQTLRVNVDGQVVAEEG